MPKYPPSTPADVSVFIEGGSYVFRTDDDVGLYTYALDKDYVSTCLGQCAQTWLPLAAPANARTIGDWAAISRGSGMFQWCYRRRPVYRNAQDEPGGGPTGGHASGPWQFVVA